MKRSKWSEPAKHAIGDSINAHLDRDPKLRADLDKLFGLVAQSYPFGARKGEQWRCWLVELKAARIELAERPVGGDHLDRPCPTCRAKAGKPCRSVGEHDALNPEFMQAVAQAPVLRGNKAPGRLSRTQKADVMHAARRDLNAPMTGVVTDA